MCPEAHARNSRPSSATAPPTASDSLLGLASRAKTTAQTKPSGTRQRCTQVPPLRATRVHLNATCVHLDRLANFPRAPQPLADRLDHAPDLYVHANPVRARAAGTNPSAADGFTPHAEVRLPGGAAAPPLPRPPKPHHRGGRRAPPGARA